MFWLRLLVVGLACAAATGCSAFGNCWGGTGVGYAPVAAAGPGCGCGP